MDSLSYVTGPRIATGGFDPKNFSTSAGIIASGSIDQKSLEQSIANNPILPLDCEVLLQRALEMPDKWPGLPLTVILFT